MLLAGPFLVRHAYAARRFVKVARGRESFAGPSVNLVLVSLSLHRRYMWLPRAPESTRVVLLLSLNIYVAVIRQVPLTHSSAVANVKNQQTLDMFVLNTAYAGSRAHSLVQGSFEQFS